MSTPSILAEGTYNPRLLLTAFRYLASVPFGGDFGQLPEKAGEGTFSRTWSSAWPNSTRRPTQRGRRLGLKPKKALGPNDAMKGASVLFGNSSAVDDLTTIITI